MTSPFTGGVSATAGGIGVSSANPLANTVQPGVPIVASAPVHGEASAVRRRILSVAVGCMLQEAGCVSVERAVVGSLVEILQSSKFFLGSCFNN